MNYVNEMASERNNVPSSLLPKGWHELMSVKSDPLSWRPLNRQDQTISTCGVKTVVCVIFGHFKFKSKGF